MNKSAQENGKSIVNVILSLLGLTLLLVITFMVLIWQGVDAQATEYIKVESKDSLDVNYKNLRDSIAESTEDAYAKYNKHLYESRLKDNINITSILESAENLNHDKIANAVSNSQLLFVGNSLVEGWRISTDTSNKFLCKVGVSFNGLDDVVYRYLSSTKFDVAFIEMGTNELGGYSEVDFKSGYHKLISKLRGSNEDCIIICVSIPPVSRSRSNGGGRFNNSNVKLYNTYVQDVVSEYSEDVYYVDCTLFFGDELNSQWTGDGIHMRGDIYKEWFEYVLDEADKIY